MKINFVDDLFVDGYNRKPGDAQWLYRDNDNPSIRTGILFVCPRCEHFGEVRFPPWHWDGNIETPTVTASILHDQSKCGWHGYLTKGTFEEC